MWVRAGDEGEALIGATRFGVFLAGKIIAFCTKPKGATVERGRGMGTIESRKTVLAVHAPISFVLLAGNDAAEERPALVNDDPQGAGWMARVRPTDWAVDVRSLVDSSAYRAHILAIEPGACLDDDQ
jgi:glycine cleavage system H protein